MDRLMIMMMMSSGHLQSLALDQAGIQAYHEYQGQLMEDIPVYSP